MKKLVLILKELKKHGVVAVKQSLEDEGAFFEDIKKMRSISTSARLGLNVKIGGCEAKNDIHFCKKIKVDGIVAPMVESQYALNKFLQTVNEKKRNSLYINLETITAFKNINSMMKSPSFKFLKGVIIGRSDLAGSLGLTKKQVDSKVIFKKVLNLLKKVKRKKIMVKMGGSITPASQEFISNLFKKKLIDRIETRNIEILLNSRNVKNLKNIIIKAFNFELEWIKYKLKNHRSKDTIFIKKEYISRIEEIEKRIKVLSIINE